MVGEEPEGVQHDDPERRDGEREERSGAARAAKGDGNQSDGDPEDQSRIPPRRLVHAQEQLRISPARGQRAEETVEPVLDLVEVPLIAGLAEGEVMLRRGAAKKFTNRSAMVVLKMASPAPTARIARSTSTSLASFKT